MNDSLRRRAGVALLSYCPGRSRAAAPSYAGNASAFLTGTVTNKGVPVASVAGNGVRKQSRP